MTIKHLISIFSILLLSIQLVSSFVIRATVYVLVQGSVFELVFLKIHQRSWIRAHLMCFCLHDDSLASLLSICLL